MRVALAGPVDPGPLDAWLDRPTQRRQSVTPVVNELAVGLLEKGVGVTVVGLDPNVRNIERYEGPLLRLYLCPRRVRHLARNAFRPERLAIRTALLDDRPDIVHAQWTYEYAWAALNSGLPTLVTAHDWAPTIFRLLPMPYYFIRMMMSFWVLVHRPRLVAVSPYLERRLGRWARGSSRVVPNALADDWFVERSQVHARDSEALKVIAVNNGWARKNVATLLKAWPDVRNSVPGVRLRLIGTAYEPDGVAQEWASARGLTEGVEFAGGLDRSQLRTQFDSADVLVHPSLEESFGLALIEAMARGVPVIAGRTSGAVPWVCAYGEAAVLVDVRDVEELAVSIISLLRDKRRRQSVALAGYDNASERFRMARIVDQHVAMYRELLDGSASSER